MAETKTMTPEAHSMVDYIRDICRMLVKDDSSTRVKGLEGKFTLLVEWFTSALYPGAKHLGKGYYTDHRGEGKEHTVEVCVPKIPQASAYTHKSLRVEYTDVRSALIHLNDTEVVPGWRFSLPDARPTDSDKSLRLGSDSFFREDFETLRYEPWFQDWSEPRDEISNRCTLTYIGGGDDLPALIREAETVVREAETALSEAETALSDSRRRLALLTERDP